ncbi:MAG: hypothetical protein AAF581_01730 [Planctomycetota bacterium]
MPVLAVLLTFSLLGGAPEVATAAARPGFQGGVCWVGPAKPDGFAYLQRNGAGWVSVTPFGYGHKKKHAPPQGGYRHSRYPGESITGVRGVIREAHKASLQVMLKPHIWFSTKDAWRGEIEMQSDEDWATWFRMYREFLDPFIEMAAAEKVAIFCIATELNGTVAREAQWRQLIADIRSRYDGQLTFAANWYQEYERIAFWDALDMIGVQAYFPLTKQQLPSVAEIAVAWQPWRAQMAAVAARTKRPIVLTEFGYKPVVGTTIEPWKWRDDNPSSVQAQLDAYEGAFQALHDAPWFRGVYAWKWFAAYSDGKPRGGRHRGNFSPQGLPAEEAMFRWYRKLAPRSRDASAPKKKTEVENAKDGTPDEQAPPSSKPSSKPKPKPKPPATPKPAGKPDAQPAEKQTPGSQVLSYQTKG